MNLTLSIGIPTYNQGEFLEKTILSVLNQTVQPYEFVVCNNHSTDKTTDEVLNKYKNQLKIITPPRFLSMVENWNYLCKYLKGDYISLLSSDDWYEPDFVETVYCYIKIDGVLYSFGNNVVDKNGNIILKEKKRSIKKQQNFPGNFYEQIRGPKVSFAAFVVRTDALKEVGFFGDDLKLLGDWGLWLKLAPLGKFYYCHKIVSNYRANYRPTISIDRFEETVSDMLHIANIQKRIINNYELNTNIFNNALKIQLYLMEKLMKENNIEKNPLFEQFKDMIVGSCIKSEIEFQFWNCIQKLNGNFLKLG